RDQRRELQRLDEMALGLDEARGAATPAEGDVLQRALTALVADRAVQRMVDQQELDHSLLGGLDSLGGGVHHHPVLDRRRAASLQLGYALDFHQAHAAGADWVAELWLVTEDRNLDIAVLGGVDEHAVFRCADLATVDREGDHLRLGPGHQIAPWAASAPSFAT